MVYIDKLRHEVAQMVHFVGVGKGSIDYITLRGMTLLKQSDLVIYPYSQIEKPLVKKMPRFGTKYNIEEMSIENIIAVVKEVQWAHMATVILTTEEPSPECEMSLQMDEFDKHGIHYDFTPGVYPKRRFEFD